MKILVPTKRVPDPDQPVRFAADGRTIDESLTRHVINPFDAIALEEAIRIRERRGGAAEILAVSIGPQDCQDVLRTGIALGADRALWIPSDVGLDSWNVAVVLARIVSREQPVIVLMGKQSIDGDANQAGQMLAALLDWPQATFASSIGFTDADARVAQVARETDAGIETVRVRLPAVITTDLRLNEPRYASLPAVMKARKRPIETISMDELGVSPQRRVRVLHMQSVTANRSCARIESTEELIARLRDEARVL